MVSNKWIKCNSIPKEVNLTQIYCGASNDFNHVLLQKIISPCRCSTSYLLGDKGRYSWLPYNLLKIPIYKRKLDKQFKCSIGKTKDKLVFVIENKVYIKLLSNNVNIKGKQVDTPNEYLMYRRCHQRVKEVKRFRLLPISYTTKLQGNNSIIKEILQYTVQEFNLSNDSLNPSINTIDNLNIDIVGNTLMISLPLINGNPNTSLIKDKNADYIIYDCKYKSLEIY